jgi:CBS domain-containing protein
VSTAVPTAPPDTDVVVHGDELPDGRRPHHHARAPVVRGEGGAVTMLCGWTGRPVDDAAQRPCCPGCARRMGGPCAAGG